MGDSLSYPVILSCDIIFPCHCSTSAELHFVLWPLLCNLVWAQCPLVYFRLSGFWFCLNPLVSLNYNSTKSKHSTNAGRQLDVFAKSKYLPRPRVDKIPPCLPLLVTSILLVHVYYPHLHLLMSNYHTF